MSHLNRISLLKPFLKRLKQNGFVGDIDSTLGTCVTTATDNSVFQVIPDVVLFPKSESDIQKIVALSMLSEFKSLRITARGGGTGTSGQSLNKWIIVDCSRHMRAITALDVDACQVTVQPGVVLSELNAFLKPHGYFFSPHVAPEDRATVGGMINTDASGKGSWRYGKTSDHVKSLRCVLEDGCILDTADRSQVSAIWDQRFNELSRLLYSNAQIIQQGISEHHRFFSGYNLKHAIREETLNLNALFCGSEGTLGIVTHAVLSIDPLPQKRTLVVVSYSSFSQAITDAFELRDSNPLAIETMDAMITTLAQSDPDYKCRLQHYFPRLKHQEMAINFIEFVDQHDLIQPYFEKRYGSDQYCILENEKDISDFWSIRRAGVEHLTRLKGARTPIPFIEDTIVSPSHLSSYIPKLCQILDEYHLTYGMYGHIDVGCIHVRPALDLREMSDVSLLDEIGKKVVQLVKHYDGLLWGEHGKGFRSHYLPYFTTSEFYQLLREVKQVFDPNNRFNPGKIVSPVTKGAQFKLTPRLKGGFDREINEKSYQMITNLVKCNGNGKCFSVNKDQLMCPSYQVTNDRRLSPKGRAMMIREWMRLKDQNYKRAQKFMIEVFDSLDTCLSCKACDIQCPASVGITAHKTRFLSEYYSIYRRPIKDYFLGFSERMLYLADQGGPVGRWILEKCCGIINYIPGVTSVPELVFSPQIQLANVTWLKSSCWEMPLGSEYPSNSVILLQDMMSKTMCVDVQIATIKLLVSLGVHVIVAPYFPLGKPLLVKGFVSEFKGDAINAAQKLHHLAALDVPIIGIEPSIILSLRDDYSDHGIDVPRVQLIQEWLVDQTISPVSLGECDEPVSMPVSLLPHCSESVTGVSRLWSQVFEKFGITIQLIQTSCCGMAGSFGLEKSHAEVSQGCFDRFWNPHLVADTCVLASGLSCLQQVKRYNKAVQVIHPIVYLEKLR
jgi:FAD/FMN-containing dehydrogenase/Fe-S oxidoreductase